MKSSISACPGSTIDAQAAPSFSENGRFATVSTPVPAKQNGGGVASWAVVVQGVG
jgi:hypothetical protein